MTYNIPFSEAINLLLEGKWLRGNNFREGCFIRLNQFGQLVLVDATDYYSETPMAFLRSLNENTYRVITVATVSELSK